MTRLVTAGRRANEDPTLASRRRGCARTSTPPVVLHSAQDSLNQSAGMPRGYSIERLPTTLLFLAAAQRPRV